jgi:hypothetical protein
MSTGVIFGRVQAAWPASMGRVAGIVYLLYFVTAILAQSLLSKSPAKRSARAALLECNEGARRTLCGLASRNFVVYGNAGNLVAYGLYVLLTLLFYYLFQPVNRSVSLLAALFSLLGCAIGVLDFFHFAALEINPLWGFGFYCLLIGYLILRSTFLPRLLGWLMAFAGLGWLAFLAPPIAKYLSPYIEALGILAEASLMLWLIFRGVNVQRLNEQTASARATTRK